MVLKLPQGHEDSKYVLNFKIGQREGGFYNARTDAQTVPPSTILAYRLKILRPFLLFYVIWFSIIKDVDTLLIILFCQ